jgi:hypothetical protein
MSICGPILTSFIHLRTSSYPTYLIPMYPCCSFVSTWANLLSIHGTSTGHSKLYLFMPYSSPINSGHSNSTCYPSLTFGLFTTSIICFLMPQGQYSMCVLCNTILTSTCRSVTCQIGAIQHSQGVIVLYILQFCSDHLGKMVPWKPRFIPFERYQTRAYRTRIAPSRTFLLHNSHYPSVFFEFIHQFYSN